MPNVTEPGPQEIRQIIGFHDGHLKGVKMLDSGDLLIGCLTAGRLEYTILFPKLEWLLVAHFSGSNILNSILLHEARKTSRDLFSKATHLDSDRKGVGS